MHYLLDSNVVIALLKGDDKSISKKLRHHKPSDIATSVIVMHELFYGAFKSQRLDHNLSSVEALNFEVLSLDKEDAYEAGKIRAYLALKGSPIGPYDVLIAGQAKARNMILVTSNAREFKRVPGLRFENWGMQ